MPNSVFATRSISSKHRKSVFEVDPSFRLHQKGQCCTHDRLGDGLHRINHRDPLQIDRALSIFGLNYCLTEVLRCVESNLSFLKKPFCATKCTYALGGNQIHCVEAVNVYSVGRNRKSLSD